MNTNNTSTQLSLIDEQDFLPIDQLNHLPAFAKDLLKLGQVLLVDCNSVRELTAAKVSALLFRHKLGYLRPLHIREEISHYHGEIRGGSISVEWEELWDMPCRSCPHYHFSFYRLFRPQELMVVNGVRIQSNIRQDAAQEASQVHNATPLEEVQHECA